MTEMPEHNANSKSNPNLLSMTGESFGAALSRSLKIGGQSAMSLRLLLALVSESLSSIAGVRSGEEFRAAYKAAIEVGAQIVLGDRPIEITLRRSWEALDWPSKWRFTAFLLRGIGSSNLDLSEDSLQALRSDDALSAIFSYLSKEFPALLQPLIHERDKYLAWSLTRSQAVNGSSQVVGVVGKGHVEGIVYALKYESDKLRFRELAGVSESQDARESSRQFLIRLVVETIVGFLLWIAFNQWHSDGDTHVFTSLFQSSRI
ncbi:hypothetical protein KP509_04G016100 [Ceratopteris richardii]|nr:hypothetical protein KP509_04G016100 [Ceratopteris richardii]